MTYLVEVGELGTLGSIVEESVILLNKRFADRLVLWINTRHFVRYRIELATA